MKKTILGIMLTLALVLALVGNVNAAGSVSASATSVKAGETVEVTVSATASAGIQFDMEYKTDYFEYVGSNVYGQKSDENDAGGVVTIMAYSSDPTVEKVTLTFKALKDTTVDGEAFTVSGFITDDDQTLTNDSVVVAVTPATPDDDDPTTDDPTTDDPTTDDPTTDDPEGPTGSNGEPVDKIPQAGAPIYAGVVAVMVVAGAILLVRKIRK